MKKFYILLIFFALGSLPYAFAQEYGWIDISANIPGTPDLSDVFFVSNDEGWITSSSHAEIYHTTDGGETFEVQTTITKLEAIYMIDENEGYTGGMSGIVYRTVDGGDNWEILGSMASTLIDIDFATATQGYTCGFGGAVFSITPEGVTNLNSGLATDLAGICVPSENHVWVVGAANIVYYDGSNWEFQTSPLGTYNNIFFINTQKGWVVGTAGLIGGTNDGGNVWKGLTALENGNSLYGVHSPNGIDVWAVGSQGTILHSPNGDDFWWNSSQDQGNNVVWNIEGAGLTDAFLRSVFFASSDIGYAVGNGKTLLKYSELTTGSEVPQESEAFKFEIHPNPTAEKFKVQCSELCPSADGFKVEDTKIEICDLNGRKLLEKQIVAGTESVEIDVNSLQSGVYFCKLITEKYSVTRKIIIQK